jgi:hypothetical protein
MTDSPLLNFSILALSLFNTILLVWLGLTILLNAERRAWGVWLIGGGILAGAFFFRQSHGDFRDWAQPLHADFD